MASTSRTKKRNKVKVKLKVKRQKSKVKAKSQKFENFVTGLIVFGTSIFILGILIFILTFFPIIKEEAKYALRNTNSTNLPTIQPTDTDFGIVIPKIAANAKVIDNVDPYNSKDYQWALTRGVAHALGTAYPGHAGNDFIFAHSSENWYIANRYNSVFYLLHKLEKGDEIDLYYKKQKYVYKVTAKKLVEASDISFLNPSSESTSTLTLMTCWPPGTTLKRLIIQAKIK